MPMTVQLNSVWFFHTNLPDDLAIKIFGFLNNASRLSASSVHSTWRRLIVDRYLKITCELGNETLRLAFREAKIIMLSEPLETKVKNALQKTLDIFADRERIINYIMNEKDSITPGIAFRAACKDGNFPLCKHFLPRVKDTSFYEQGVVLAIQQGHVDLVKILLPNVQQKRLQAKICIQVQYTAEKGESLFIRGVIGEGAYDLNTWDGKGFPMRKITTSSDLWEIILLPVINEEEACFLFEPILQRENGQILMSKIRYAAKAGSEITLTPEF